MIPEFHSLNDSEIELALKAPILVCILVAGADGTIDRKELREAIAIASEQRNNHSPLSSYFKLIAEDFEDKVKIVLQGYPHDPVQRNPVIIDELSRLNSLWPLLDKTFSIPFYELLLVLAEKIALSSGGILGIRAVGTEEAKYVSLPMIQHPEKN